MEPEELMTLAQAAKYANVSRRTLLYHIHKGTLQAERRVTFTGVVWLTTRQAVDRWKEQPGLHRPGPKPD